MLGEMMLAGGIGWGWRQLLASAVLTFASLICLLSSHLKCWLMLRNEIDPNITVEYEVF